MPAMAVPISAAKLDAWKRWAAELTGSRKSEFAEMNRRFGITEHRAYLQATPDGNFLAVVYTDGPGSEEFTPKVVASSHPFDRWFVQSVSDIHGIDPSGPLPPSPVRFI